MISEWDTTNVKYSILRALWEQQFKEWKFAIPTPETMAGMETQFFPIRPTGTYPRPSIAIEYQSAQPQRTMGMYGELQTYALLVLGRSVVEVERMLGLVKVVLPGMRVVLWEWMPKSKTFSQSLVQQFMVKPLGDRMIARGKSPECSMSLTVER